MARTYACGACKGRHATINAIRACSERAADPTSGGDRYGPGNGRNRESARVIMERYERVQSARTEAVPAGRYAVKIGDTLRFFKVDKPTDGRWAGYTFVSEQAGDNEYRVTNRERREGIIAAIAVNPGERARRYGRELGRCGVCNRTLTDATSRANGIGPVCAEKF